MSTILLETRTSLRCSFESNNIIYFFHAAEAMATPLTLPLEFFFEILNMEIVVNNKNNNNFHTNCNLHTMDIVWK